MFSGAYVGANESFDNNLNIIRDRRSREKASCAKNRRYYLIWKYLTYVQIQKSINYLAESNSV